MIALAALALSLTPTQSLELRSLEQVDSGAPSNFFGIEAIDYPDGGTVVAVARSSGGLFSGATELRVTRMDSNGRTAWEEDFSIPTPPNPQDGTSGLLAEVAVLGDGAIAVGVSGSPIAGSAYLTVFEPSGALRFGVEFESTLAGARQGVAALGPVGPTDCLLHFEWETGPGAPGRAVSTRVDGATGAEVWRSELDVLPWGGVNATGRAAVRDDALYFVARQPGPEIWAYKLDASGAVQYATSGVLPEPSFLTANTRAIDVGPGGEVVISSRDGASLLDPNGVAIDVPALVQNSPIKFAPDGRVFGKALPPSSVVTCVDGAGALLWQRSDILRVTDLVPLTSGAVGLLRPDASTSTSATVTTLDANGQTIGSVRLEMPGPDRVATRASASTGTDRPWFTITGQGPGSNAVTGVFGLAVDTADAANFCGQPIANSTGQSGRLRGVGSGEAADDAVTLFADRLPPGQTVLFLNSRTTDSVQNVGGGFGRLCLGGTINRYVGPGEIQSVNAAGVAWLDLSLGDTPDGASVVSVLAGETWRYQAWHRDLVGGAQTSNLTGAAAVTYR